MYVTYICIKIYNNMKNMYEFITQLKNWTLFIINIYVYHLTLYLDPEIASILNSMFSILLL